MADRKLAEENIVNTIPDGATFFFESGGRIYRISKENFIKFIGATTTTPNTTPAAPTLSADDTNNTLSASHALGATEILVSENNGAYTSYTGTINVGNEARVAGYWKFKVKAATGRNESPVVSSPVFTVTAAPATITASWGWSANDPYAAIVAGTDNIIYVGTANLADNNAAIIADVKNGSGQFIVVKVPSSVSDKSLWADGTYDGFTFTQDAFNFGQIPDSVFRERVSVNNFDYYITRVQASFNTGSTNRLRLS